MKQTCKQLEVLDSVTQKTLGNPFQQSYSNEDIKLLKYCMTTHRARIRGRERRMYPMRTRTYRGIVLA
jgi:hypothetical protein